jgi:hypothetical protein
MEAKFLAQLAASQSRTEPYYKEHDRYAASSIDAESGSEPYYKEHDRYAESSKSGADSETVDSKSLSTPLLKS